MGYGVPAAIGAKIAFPQRQVVAFVGDGGFMMTGQEIATAFHHGVAPIMLVFNNSMYGTIRMYQERAYPGRSAPAPRSPTPISSGSSRHSADTARRSRETARFRRPFGAPSPAAGRR